MNIHGALCPENFDSPFVEPVPVDGNSAVQLPEKNQANNPDKSVIHVIWDKAACHRDEAVKKWLARAGCRIHLIQLPTYCPHLNPAERMWAVLHQYVTHNKYCSIPMKFTEAAVKFFRKTISKNRRQFTDQVTDNFRMTSHQNFWVSE